MADKENLTESIGQLASSFSDEAQEAARAKVKELGFKGEEAIVGFEETLANLSHVRDLLLDSVIKNKLTQIPLTVQTTLKDRLESASKPLVALANGKDQLLVLSKAVEDLYAYVWRYGLHNLTDEYVSYQTKLNQLKNLEVRTRELQMALEESLKVKTAVEQLQEVISAAATDAENTIETLHEQEALSKTSSQETVDASEQSSAKLAAIEEQLSQSENAAATAANNSGKVEALRKSIEEFHGQIAENKKALDDTRANAEQTVADNEKSTKELVEQLRALELQIKVQIEKATGFSLFKSFQRRQQDIVKAKIVWACGVFLSLLGIAGLTLFISSNVQPGMAFYIKLSMYAPLAYLVWFCTHNYSHERRLEEEYAFKGNISVSLTAYRDLVKEAVGPQTKYAEFLIQTVNNVFTSPTDKVFGSGKKDVSFDKNVQKAMEILKQVADIAKPIKPT